MSTDSPATFLLLSSCPVKKLSQSTALRLLRRFNCCSSSADSLDSIYLPTTPKELWALPLISRCWENSNSSSYPLSSCNPSLFLPSFLSAPSPHIQTHARKIRVAFWRGNFKTPVLFSLMTNSDFCNKSSASVRGVNWVTIYICLVLIPFPRPLSIIVPRFNVACVIFC